MSGRKKSPLHDVWHPRVEGQIRSCMMDHPEWFKLPNAAVMRVCVNSLAKRIVGEIVVAAYSAVAPERDGVGSPCAVPSASVVGTTATWRAEGDARLLSARALKLFGREPTITSRLPTLAESFA